MAITYRTVTGNLADLLRTDFDPSTVRITVRTNLDSGDAPIDLTNGQILLGTGRVTVASDGTFSTTNVIDHASTDVNPTGIQYRWDIDYTPRNGQRVTSWTSGFVNVTADADLSTLVATQYVPPSYQNAFIAEAEAIRDEIIDLSGIAVPDALVEALVKNTGGAGPLTSAALTATFAYTDGPRPVYVNAYDEFFLGPSVVGQGGTSTTTTSTVTAGASVLPVASGAAYPNGTIMILNAGTAQQSQHRVTSGGGTTSLTVTPVLPALANGAPVSPFWSDDRHPTDAGMNAWLYWVLRATRPDGTPVFTNPGTTRPIVWLGNSWAANAETQFPAAVAALFPTAVSDALGIGGNNSASLLARFDTDVPSNASYVIINEPGINDAGADIDWSVQAAHLDQLIAKIQAIGAVAVVTGGAPVPTFAGQMALQADRLAAQMERSTKLAPSVSDVIGVLAPDVLVAANNTRNGYQALGRVTTGIDNTALGHRAHYSLTTGNQNTGVGSLVQLALTSGVDNSALGVSAQASLTSGGQNVGIGNYAQFGLLTGTDNTAVGVRAQYGLTTGIGNTAMGRSAQNAVSTGGSNAAFGNQAQAVLTTGSENVAVGHVAQAALTTASSNTAVGSFAQNALTTGTNNSALGRSAEQSLTTGNQNTAVGRNALHNPNGVGANATTTASNQTAVGFETGQSGTTQVDHITVIGYRAIAGGTGSVALGSGAQASHANAVALGYNAITTAIDQLQLGARHIEVTELAADPAAGATNAGRLYVKDNGAGKTQLCVRFPTGVVQILATEP